MFPEFATAGGLMAYGPDLDGLYRELGVMAGKVLKGSKPAELPAERPTRLEIRRLEIDAARPATPAGVRRRL
jgi:putative ABC transport system substrate-binding protein